MNQMRKMDIFIFPLANFTKIRTSLLVPIGKSSSGVDLFQFTEQHPQWDMHLSNVTANNFCIFMQENSLADAYTVFLMYQLQIVLHMHCVKYNFAIIKFTLT